MDLTEVIDVAAVRRARSLVRELEDDTLAEQLRIVAIPAPSLAEGARAAYLLDRFSAAGLVDCGLDEVGNALGRLSRGGGDELGPVLISAHLDTVFGTEVDVTPRRSGDRVQAPGITDNARGLAALLSVARALVEARVVTRRTVWFVCTVGEEGIGDLRGSKHLFRRNGFSPLPSAFIALDGSGIRRIVHRAIGARRLRVEIAGPGGHSWSDWGTVNPLHALGRSIERILRRPLPDHSHVTRTVARAGGGTSVNAIPAAAWFELDLRSELQEPIAEAERACREALEEVVTEENSGRKTDTPPLTLAVRVIGDRPSGHSPAEAPLVRSALAATRLVGAKPELVASSTDANVPLSLGIPAVALGAGGESGGIHTTEEWFSNRQGALGLERALLTLLAAAGVVR